MEKCFLIQRFYGILGAWKNGDLLVEKAVVQSDMCNQYVIGNPEASSISVRALENVVFFSYYVENLYLLEKREDIKSY